MPDADAHVLETLRRLRGVVGVFVLDARDRQALRDRATPVSAENRGMEQVLGRRTAVCLFKDPTFRPPPEPTLLLVDEAGHILGRELVAGEAEPSRERRFAHLGKDFVLFADVRPHGRLRFLLPPVRFPELDALEGVDRVVSASPDSPQDEYLRERFRMDGGPHLASVLVGYDGRNP